jgi:ribose 5-phosphate isomerase B
MKLVIGNDHTAVHLKEVILHHVQDTYGCEVINVGTDSSQRCNYPEYGLKAALMVADGSADAGILICGTGVGISLAANKVKGIRCAVCSEPYSAKLSKQHNNTNMLAFGARVVGDELAKMIVDAWMQAEFEGGRHEERIAMIDEIGERYG